MPSWREAPQKAPTMASSPSSLRTARTERAPSGRCTPSSPCRSASSTWRSITSATSRAWATSRSASAARPIAVLVAGGERQAQAGDRRRVEHGGEAVGEVSKLELRRA